jgi:alpha-glucosidase
MTNESIVLSKPSCGAAPTESAMRPWWRGATIYQVYPRSFADSNGDGIGDLTGIANKLDYIASLGVDAVWLSPFFISPMHDFGYDVADYCDVDPIFGTLADFDALIAKAHALGLKVLIDQVYAHTSDLHDWFAQSRSDRDHDKADWYVWADAKPDGSPPNNWQSVFGGPAWTWDARRCQYYMHNFLSTQPQLNCHNPQVQEALIGVAKFWLDRGVNGFRVDAINFAMHDPALTDNPPAAPGNSMRTRPFDFQKHIHNQSHPDIPIFIQRIRALTDEYEACFTVAEVGGSDAESEMRSFTAGEAHFNSAYGFNFLYAEQLTPALVREAVEAWPDTPGMGWPSWAFSNHDAPRWISRWAAPDVRDRFARMAMLLFVCLRGNIIIWQGEELGLPQVEIAFEDLRDPEAIANWPLTLSRDGTRTPMPWVADAPNLGFSMSKPWLPLGKDHGLLAIDQQEADGTSLLALTRRLITFRNNNEALLVGRIVVIEAKQDRLVFERATDTQHLLCAYNFGPEPLSWWPPQPENWCANETVGGAEIGTLPGFSGIVLERIG